MRGRNGWEGAGQEEGGGCGSPSARGGIKLDYASYMYIARTKTIATPGHLQVHDEALFSSLSGRPKPSIPGYWSLRARCPAFLSFKLETLG